MNMLSRIGLGTVQFGMDYGISNEQGRPPEAEVAAILEKAAGAGIQYIDTAASYGDAERLIGKHLPRGHRLRIVTKTSPLSDARLGEQHRRWLIDAVAASCERLRVERLYGVLLHHGSDLTKIGAEYLVAALDEVKSRGWVERIGFSIYDGDELAGAVARLTPDLVQLPFNVLDRRLLTAGWLERLKAAGAEVHARSVFLQGLLLMEPAAMPDAFAPARAAIGSLRERWTARRLSPVTACLHFVLSNPGIDAAIVGVNRLSEFEEIEAAVSRLGDGAEDFEPLAPLDAAYLDPRRWSQINPQRSSAS